MSARADRINRICHRLGLAIAAPLLAVAAAGVSAWWRGIVPFDGWDLAETTAEIVGATLFYTVVAAVVYLILRTIGWIAAEVVG